MKNSFTPNLLKWHSTIKRDMPWKKNKDPYKIWLSEIILQQTRIAQGMPYYEKMIRLFPTVKDLAYAPEDKIMKAWEGLGYYSRARNMHTAAMQVLTEYNGKFPSAFEDIILLKGVGEYTAAAIASFAFDLPYAVVDGNVYRVISRAFGIHDAIDKSNGKAFFKNFADRLLDKERPAAFNQAIMDFGATVCTPANPDCISCFYKNNCIALKKNLTDVLPVKSKKIAVKIRWFYFFVISNQEQFIIEKRNLNDIWKGLYQFPLLESEKFILPEIAIDNFVKKFRIASKFKIEDVSNIIEHKLTHQTIKTQFIFVKANVPETGCINGWLIIEKTRIKSFAFPKVIDNYLKILLH